LPPDPGPTDLAAMTGTRLRVKLLILAAVVCAAAVLWLSRSDRRGSAPEESGAEVLASPVDSLAWLAGCWELEEPEFRREEQWMRPAGGTLVGMSRSVADGRTVEYEYLRIEVRDGSLAYVASPSGQAETVFTLEELTDRSVRFAAPEHDFPQRIVYERVSPRAILAWVEGDVEGVSRVIEFPMVAARCP
jgi:hypothetical protein